MGTVSYILIALLPVAWAVPDLKLQVESDGKVIELKAVDATPGTKEVVEASGLGLRNIRVTIETKAAEGSDQRTYSMLVQLETPEQLSTTTYLPNLTLMPGETESVIASGLKNVVVTAKRILPEPTKEQSGKGAVQGLPALGQDISDLKGPDTISR